VADHDHAAGAALQASEEQTVMNLICASICYRGYAADEVAATLESAPGIGYRQMEVHGPALWSIPAAKAFDLKAVKARVEASGMKCVGLHVLGFGGKDNAEVRERAQAIAACFGYAEALGCHHLTATGASRRDENGAMSRLIACLEQVLAATPSPSPVKLTLEPHFGNVLEQAKDFERVLAAVPDPRVGFCVDTGHFHSARVDTLAFIRKHAARIHAVHLKDHIGAVSVGIGRGEIDLPAIVTALCETGYAGGLTLELEVKDSQNLPRYTEEAYIYLSGLLGRKL
jgi:sugar phosphate isomerase/epimerase